MSNIPTKGTILLQTTIFSCRHVKCSLVKSYELLCVYKIIIIIITLCLSDIN